MEVVVYIVDNRVTSESRLIKLCGDTKFSSFWAKNRQLSQCICLPDAGFATRSREGEAGQEDRQFSFTAGPRLGQRHLGVSTHCRYRNATIGGDLSDASAMSNCDRNFCLRVRQRKYPRQQIGPRRLLALWVDDNKQDTR